MQTNNYNYGTGVGDSFDNGWKIMNRSFLPLFLVTFILAILDGPKNMFQYKMNPGDFPMNMDGFNWENFSMFSHVWAVIGTMALVFVIFALAYNFLLLPILKFGRDMMFVQAARGIKPDFNYLIQGFKENYFQIILANLLVFGLIMIGFFALIIPGIIVACRLVFVSYLVMDKKLDPIAAVEESWRMTSGHGWTVFGMAIISFFIFILGLIMCIVGVFPAMVWIGASFASLYEAVSRERMPKEDDTVPVI
jgi:uncharacterized membrane protein